MMTGTRIRIDYDGNVEIVDPGFDSLELLRAIDPDFRIEWSELPGFSSPRFLQTRETSCDIGKAELAKASEEELWHVHDAALELRRAGNTSTACGGERASLLDIKIELSRRMLESCQLCARRCGVDRAQGELGICGLGIEATVSSHFVHIAEEPPINPSLLICLAGCGMRCRYCQQWELLSTDTVDGKALDATLWAELDTEGARSLSFIGGNPDESLYAVLRFLDAAPSGWKLPVVWNCHGYGSPEVIKLLDGVVDVHVPDIKYGDERCGRELSDAPGYPRAARTTVSAMVVQGVPVIVRILVLPGHFRCCHAPVLDFLSSLSADDLFVPVRGQYCPDWRIASQDGAMARRPCLEEVEQVRQRAISLGLNVI